MLVAVHERVEEQFVDALGLGVDADARIEIVGTALDDHDQRVGVGLARTGAEGEQERGGQQEIENFRKTNLYHRGHRGCRENRTSV